MTVFAIGSPVLVRLNGQSLHGIVQRVRIEFLNGATRYNVILANGEGFEVPGNDVVATEDSVTEEI